MIYGVFGADPPSTLSFDIAYSMPFPFCAFCSKGKVENKKPTLQPWTEEGEFQAFTEATPPKSPPPTGNGAICGELDNESREGLGVYGLKRFDAQACRPVTVLLCSRVGITLRAS